MFSKYLDIRKTTANRYRLLKDLVYEDEKYIIIIKQGFTTDGATIPKFFWMIIGSPFVGKYIMPSIVHDGLYKSHILNKQESDLLYYKMMSEKGVWLHRRKIMYYAVKFFAVNAWNKKELSKKFISIKIK